MLWLYGFLDLAGLHDNRTKILAGFSHYLNLGSSYSNLEARASGYPIYFLTLFTHLALFSGSQIDSLLTFSGQSKHGNNNLGTTKPKEKHRNPKTKKEDSVGADKGNRGIIELQKKGQNFLGPRYSPKGGNFFPPLCGCVGF